MRPQDRLIAADLTQRDPRWAKVLARDSSADGQFYYSVRSTGVYCRPSCAARPARPENVRFHTSRSEAERAGFRPCKRCKPDQPAAVLDYAIGTCSLGLLLVARGSDGLRAILLGDDTAQLEHDLRTRFPRNRLRRQDAELTATLEQVRTVIDTPASASDLPLAPQGTAFQQRVWQALRQIPAGRTMSYGEIARQLGAPNAVRAVAQACAANPLAVAIPCHRVVRSDGGLSGYRWGIDRKRALLAREAQA